jgi:hypothetical protein
MGALKLFQPLLLTLFLGLPSIGLSAQFLRCHYFEGYLANTSINFSLNNLNSTTVLATTYPGSGESSDLEGSYRNYSRESIASYEFSSAALSRLSVSESDVSSVTFYSLDESPLRDFGDLKLLVLFNKGENNQNIYAGAYGSYLGHNIYCPK